MFLKKATIVSMLALAVGASSVSAVSAATATKAKAVKVSSSTYIINGISADVHSYHENGKTLVSVRELSTKLGVKLQSGSKGTVRATLNNHELELKMNSNVIKVDGVDQKLQVPVKSVNGTTYVELTTYVKALGALFALDSKGAIWIDADLIGNVDHIQWANSARFIASQETENGRVDFLVNALTGKYEKLLDASDASDLVVSPDGTKAAFSNAAGEVFLLDLNTKVSTKVSADTSIKPEMVWSADGASLFFLQGDKGNVIAKLNLSDGTISKVLDDKVEYKENLGVSANGKSFTYTVAKAGSVKADGSKPVEEDDVAIDMTGTEPQIFLFDSSIKDGKPVQLTSNTDDKVFVQATADAGSVSFVSIGNDEAAKSALVSVGSDKTVKKLFDEQDVLQAVMAEGKWYLLTAGTANNQFIYEVDPATGVSKKLYTVSDSVTEIVVKPGAPLAIISNGRVYLDIQGHWKPTTR